MRTAPLACAALLTTVVTGCGGGGDDPRAALRDYIDEANAVQARYAPAFRAANAAYAAQAGGKVAPAAELPRLEAAERALQAARSDVARLDPPAKARELQRRLLDVLGLNAGLAHQTTQLARYARDAPRALRPLAKAGRTLQRELSADATPDAQAATLTRYQRRLDGVLDRLGELDVPVVLRPSHELQVSRLEETRRLAGRLRAAVSAADAPELARLLLRFREVSAGPSPLRRRTIAARGIRAYTQRLNRLQRAETGLTREQNRLKREVAA